MKPIREQLRMVLESEGEIRNLVIVFQLRGKKAEAVHSFDSTAEAIAFVNGALLLSDDELLKVLRGRQQ
jgi:hypothetical protein